jgi:hypothetical protein
LHFFITHWDFNIDHHVIFKPWMFFCFHFSKYRLCFFLLIEFLRNFTMMWIVVVGWTIFPSSWS